MTDEQSALLEMYKEHTTMARHHELQRERVTNLILAISAALLVFVAGSGAGVQVRPLGLFMVALGIFGALFSYKHYERFRFHTTIAGEFRDELENLLSGVSLASIRGAAASQHEQRFKMSSSWKLHVFWIALNFLIVLLGIALAFDVFR